VEIYLVGGAVRDELLNYPVVERDWVVVGARPEDLLTQGYQQVGKDFPVFLHPTTKDEYALARTERKKGHGYTGFSVDFDPGVTLEDDLIRRDLTINAMARSADGELIDPYGGRKDLDARVLRHVSDAFLEDPLRVLRTARFMARYAHLGFHIAPETTRLMCEIVDSGELQHLPNERVWVEMDRALGERDPDAFISVMRECGALAVLLPELDALFGVPQNAEYHPEVDTGVHSLMALRLATALSSDTSVRFAALIHDLGKGTTPKNEWPRHIAHEHRGLKLVRGLCQRLAVPNQHRDLALLVCEYHTHSHRARALRGKTLMKLLTATDALRRPERFDQFLLACEADARGRQGMEQGDYPQADYLRRALTVAQAVKTGPLVEQGISGKALGQALVAERVKQLEALRQSQDSTE
jgi:tRNA nucleotidyltransferase (CCA-adding enzyme)